MSDAMDSKNCFAGDPLSRDRLILKVDHYKELSDRLESRVRELEAALGKAKDSFEDIQIRIEDSEHRRAWTEAGRSIASIDAVLPGKGPSDG